MAVLEKIRTRMGILVSIIIGLSLLAFVLGDFLGNGKSVLSGDQMEVAKISGKSIDIKEFESKITKLSEVYQFQTGQKNLTDEMTQNIREQCWQQLVEDYVLGDECSELGVEVSTKEMLDMVQGANPHPYVKQLFTNQETQVFNRAAVVQFIKSLDQDENKERKGFWLYMEGQINRERVSTKYYNLIKKGLYSTSLQVNAEVKDNSKKVNCSFISEKYNSIADSTIKVSEGELKDYLNSHESDFQQEASRDIEYIVYNIIPSPDDFQVILKGITDIKQEFIASTEVKQFVNLSSDVSFVEKYLKQEELPDTLKGLYNAKIGEVYGPYFENNVFKLARLVDVKNISDSVRASHILIKPEAQTKEAFDKAKATADSLKNVITKGGNFEALAKIYSTDGSASKGGDLGWFKEGAMVKSFSDACFNGKKGEVVVVESQFGIHVINITDKGKEVKKVQVGIIERKLEASEGTQQAIYQKASAFAGNNNTGDKFVAAVKKQGLVLQTGNSLNENMKEVPGIENSRELVRWAFKAEKNTISGVMEFGDKFVIARLSQIREKGTAKVEDVKDQLVSLVRKDKKAEKLIEKLKQGASGTNSIGDAASKLNLQVETANDVTFASYTLGSFGFEPSVVAAATTLPVNTLSNPVKGNNGVYLVFVTETNNTEANTEMIKSRLTGMAANRVGYEVFNTLKKIAEVNDERAKFY